jgi:hypothetical protein
MVDRLNPRPAWLCRRLTSKFSGAQSSFLRPGGNYCRFARQNEAALRRTLSRARSKRHRRFETRSLAELSVSRYDEAIVS